MRAPSLRRKYIAGNPTSDVKHFNERQERPSKRMLTVDEEHRILEAAPAHLRVAIVLLVQTGGRTYSEGLSLRWDQVDLVHSVIHPGSSVKTTDSAQPLPLSRLACEVLKEWKKEQNSDSPFVFPSPRKAGKPIRSVKRAVVRQNSSRDPKRGGSWWSRQAVIGSIEQEDSGGGQPACA